MKRPVFVIGSPRSGTTLLHHMLLSAGGFAIYDIESNVFNTLVPTFGNLSVNKNRQELVKAWLQSNLFQASGLNADSIKNKILAECNHGGDFLRIVMEEIARHQKVDRWTEHTPSHLFHIPEIKKFFPDALVVHVIRDGRDVAVSLGWTGWLRQLPGHKDNSRLAAGLYWDWMVTKGRNYGRKIAPDYIEVRYEELVLQPRPTLARLSEFIQHDLDYDRIQKVAIGSVRKPNTSFTSEHNSEAFNPVGRWKRALKSSEIAKLERLIGSSLQELGYPLASVDANAYKSSRLSPLRALYLTHFNSMLWLKKNTPLHRYFASRNIDYRISH